MSKYTNNLDIPLGLAVWLVNDDYDYQDIPGYISATYLMKPLRQIILGKRISDQEPEDLADLIPRSLGNAIHDSIEKAWTKNKEKNLKALGYSDNLISRTIINPTEDEIKEAIVPIYIEKRSTKEVGNYVIGGKFDMCIDGILHDIKTTSTYSWQSGSKDEEYALQGSIYRYLNPDIIESDFIRIMFVFTDWQKYRVGSTEDYPESRIAYRNIPLMSIEETEKWIKDKLAQLDKYMDSPEPDIPHCPTEELWMNTPKHRYYKGDPTKAKRATRTFDNLYEAVQYQRDQGGVGVIVSDKLEPKRCGYCPVFNICTQKDAYFND